MKNSSQLKVGTVYEVRYRGYHGYDAYNGTGTYTGKIDDAGDEGIFYGFYLPECSYEKNEEPNWFPLEDVFAIN